jgi:RNA polymerase sigma-70 factor (ECF subfamily)
MPKTLSNQMVDHLFRHESGRMVAVLLRIFGMHHLGMVEDVVQESFIKALQSWKISGVPDNPSGWLMQVAKNRALDILKQKKNRATILENLPSPGLGATTLERLFHEQEISDSQLQLIFACCHPALKEEDQIALTLKTVSGFSVSEIANSLLIKPDAIRQRLHRAKKFIAENGMSMEIPAGKELLPRIQPVLTVLYLLFNEGYNSTTNEEIIRRDLCAEAMRLTKFLVEHPAGKNTSAPALLALMCYHAARFDARIDEDGQIILLQNQDRSKWNRQLMAVGHHYMKMSTDIKPVTSNHLEAAIACEHCMSPDFESMDWNRLIKMYTYLYEIRPIPIVKLNLLVVHIQNQDFPIAEKILTELNEEDFPGKEYLYFSVLSEFYFKKGLQKESTHYLNLAISYCQNPTEKRMLEKRLSARC